jgi:hypothetical protein
MAAYTKATRFYAKGITKVLFAAAIANPENPTRAELTAAVNVTPDLADLSGWNTKGEMIAVPDLNSRFTKQISGDITADASSITFYGDIKGKDIRTVQPRGTTGYMIFMDGGDVTGAMMDLFPVEVTSVGKVRSVSPTASQVTIDYAITDVPIEDIAIPAGA